MNSTWKSIFVLPLAAACVGLCLPATAQVPNPTAVAPGATHGTIIAEGPDGVYVYHVKVVDRELDAVNYLNRSGSTKIAFQGTSLLPQAHGEGKINAVTGKTEISVKFDGLKQANSFGQEYLTYVLWAITPNGRPQNLGELELAGGKANIDVTSSYQTMGLIVTAEPYFSVSMPSDVVVLQNVFTDKTNGILQHVNVHYTLLPRGLYAPTKGQNAIAYPVTDRMHTPLALFEAWNAERIAKQAGADKYAPEIMEKAGTELKNATAMQNAKKRDVKMIFTYARSATQNFEDARIATARKQQAESVQNTKDQAAEAKIEAANSQANADAAAAAKARADAARARAEADAANARANAAEAEHNAQKSEANAAATREKLRAQLNAVLATTESARGLIVNMSDVLFDTGKYTLKPEAQVKLAKVATILALYPGLKVQVEGYTDTVGGDAYNQKLSENRADAVEQFLTSNGVPQGNATAQGFGKANPVADNSTAAGRSQNRRVNLVVSGNAIGIENK